MWPYDVNPDDVDEQPAVSRPRLSTGLEVSEVAGRLVRLDGKAIAWFSEQNCSGRVLATQFDKRTLIALLSAFLSQAVVAGITAESVSVEDVLWHLDMCLAKDRSETHTPF